jgi:hypothetical protein
MATSLANLSPRQYAGILNLVVQNKDAASILADDLLSDDDALVLLAIEGIKLDYENLIITECIQQGYRMAFADLAKAGCPFFCRSCSKIVTISSSCSVSGYWHTTHLLGQLATKYI